LDYYVNLESLGNLLKELVCIFGRLNLLVSKESALNKLLPAPALFDRKIFVLPSVVLLPFCFFFFFRFLGFAWSRSSWEICVALNFCKHCGSWIKIEREPNSRPHIEHSVNVGGLLEFIVVIEARQKFSLWVAKERTV